MTRAHILITTTQSVDMFLREADAMEAQRPNEQSRDPRKSYFSERTIKKSANLVAAAAVENFQGNRSGVLLRAIFTT